MMKEKRFILIYKLLADCSSMAGTELHPRILESLRLEKTSKIIKSNHQPNTTMPAKPCPEVQHLDVC